MDTRQATIYNVFLIAGIGIGCILLYFMSVYLRLHRRQVQSDRQRAQNELSAIEQERSRIAADLHDDLGPVLSSAKLKLSAVETLPADDQQLINEAGHQIDSIVDKIRNIANGLMPHSLTQKGLVAAVQEYIHSLPASSLQIEFLPYQQPAISNDAAIHLYRIIQELIHNVLKHAQASRIRLQWFSRAGRFVIICSDDGIGFISSSQRINQKNAGLRNILHRCDLLHARMYVKSQPGHGTEIMIEIPEPVSASKPITDQSINQ